jgi:hypothetical protein
VVEVEWVEVVVVELEEAIVGATMIGSSRISQVTPTSQDTTTCSQDASKDALVLTSLAFASFSFSISSKSKELAFSSFV